MNLVQVESGTPVTSSQTIAAVFGKRHCNVMASITSQMEKLRAVDPEWVKENFILSLYASHNGRLCSYFYLTKIAFAKVVFNYTGSKVTAYQLRFLRAFENLESTLTQNNTTLNIPSERVFSEPSSIAHH